MRWTPGGRSKDLEDDRNQGGSVGGFRRGGIKVGLGGIVVLLLLSVIFKRDFLSLIDTGTGTSYSTGETRSDPERDAREEPMVQFVSFVLDDTQNTWSQVFPSMGAQYRNAKLVLFRDYVESACGLAESATGPFYCPEDEKVYIDLGFFDELQQRFDAPGEFAQAYVLAHEIGHHIQKILGIEARVRQLQRAHSEQAKALSVRMELQADCLAGVWGHSTAQRNILENGDVESGLGAAAAVGDDRIQRMSTGRVSPESFTHGSSAQRMEWFRRGLTQGNVEACNTFQ
jgi:predicted metalloprotease